MDATFAKRVALVLASLIVTGCSSSKPLLQAPAVNLASVEVSEMSFKNQTFLLGFNVSNPNAVALPVRSIKYRVRLNDQNFAGGETQSNFTIPAGGAERFEISVDLDLLRSGPQLASLLRSGVKDNVQYELHGNLQVDLPLVPVLRFTDTGTIAVQAELF